MTTDLADVRGRSGEDTEARLSEVEHMLGLVESTSAHLTQLMEAVFEAGRRLDPNWRQLCPDDASGWERYDVQVLGDGIHVEWRDYDQWGGFDTWGMHLTAEDLADPEAGARRQRRLHEEEVKALAERRAAEKAAADADAQRRRREQYEAMKAEFEPGGRLA